LAIGLPLTVLNIFVLQFIQGQAIDWQYPLTAILDVIQPGILDAVVYPVI
jgi:hypothetical protein